MITFYPSDAIVAAMGGFTSKFYRYNDWWMIYQWFCRELIEFRRAGDVPYEFFTGMGSRNNDEFYPLRRIDEPVERIAYLLKGVVPAWMSKDSPTDRQVFLRRLKIRSWAALGKSITFSGRRPKVFPRREWFKMVGRTLRRPGPNECHPNALSVRDFSLSVYAPNKGWVARIHYGYPHDAGWTIDLYQNRREALDTFATRIDAWIDEKIEPDVQPGKRWLCEMIWDRTNKAVGDLFWGGGVVRLDAEIDLPDILVGVPGPSLVTGRIKLDKNKLRTLKRWASASKTRSLRGT